MSGGYIKLLFMLVFIQVSYCEAADLWKYNCTINNNVPQDITFARPPGLRGADYQDKYKPSAFTYRLITATHNFQVTDNQRPSGSTRNNINAVLERTHEYYDLQFTATPYSTGMASAERKLSEITAVFSSYTPDRYSVILVNNMMGSDYLSLYIPDSYGVAIYSNISSRISFPDGLVTEILLPDGPLNEYERSEIVFEDTVTSMKQELSDIQNLNASPGVFNIPIEYPVQKIVCVRMPTPLELTLGSDIINFGNIQQGTNTPIIRKLDWKVSGNGNVASWTIQFNSPDQKGEKILLGGAGVTIQDALGNQVPPATDYPLPPGATGYFNLLLDPEGINSTGTYSTTLNVTFTAN